jgi:type I restriction enzyme S subunit
VDACRARLGRVPALLKRFRQAVLAAAVAGRLTEDWRGENPELLSSQELVARLSQRISKNSQGQLRLNDAERFIEADLPSGWQFAPVSLVGDVYLGRQRSPENHNGPYMRSYMRAANITWQGWDLSDVKQMNFDPKDFARYKLQVGDVLINEGSGSADEVGKPAIWQGDVEDCCFQNTLICVRPYEEMSKYLYFVFLHAAMSKSFVEDTRGVNIYHIGKDRFSAYLIPLPSLAEQYEIIRRVETLFAYADRLEARLAATRARVDQLTPSLLGQAFRGELNAE